MPEEKRDFRRSENARREVAKRIYDAMIDEEGWNIRSRKKQKADANYESPPVTPPFNRRGGNEPADDAHEGQNGDPDDNSENISGVADDGQGGDSEESDTDEEEIEEDVYNCPRWNEIKKYLVRNCGPLAIDTMGMMSEQLFLKYIKSLRAPKYIPLQITPLEFRSFLGTASEKRELFLYV